MKKKMKNNVRDQERHEKKILAIDENVDTYTNHIKKNTANKKEQKEYVMKM